MIVEPACQAVIGLTFSTYLVQPFYPTCVAPYYAVRLIAAVIICKFPKAPNALMFHSMIGVLLWSRISRKTWPETGEAESDMPTDEIS